MLNNISIKVGVLKQIEKKIGLASVDQIQGFSNIALQLMKNKNPSYDKPSKNRLLDTCKSLRKSKNSLWSFPKRFQSVYSDTITRQKNYE